MKNEASAETVMEILLLAFRMLKSHSVSSCAVGVESSFRVEDIVLLRQYVGGSKLKLRKLLQQIVAIKYELDS